MVKLFFADSGSLDDLHRTLESVAHAAEERRLELIEMIEATDDATAEFGRRLHINALALRFHLDYEAFLGRWAAWARLESAAWPSVDDPGSWRWRDALSVD